jgi:hypothetical protein
MEPAMHDLTRQLDEAIRRRVPQLEVELEVIASNGVAEKIDDVLSDPWFATTEEEFRAIEDDPTAKIIEIRLERRDYG